MRSRLGWSEQLQPTLQFLSAVLALALVAGACTTEQSAPPAAPTRLALAAPITTIAGHTSTSTSSKAALSTPPTTVPAVELGTPEQPFTPLPQPDQRSALVTPTGVIVPILKERSGAWLVASPCQNTRYVTEGTTIGRAHVVLDPGHGGAEPGAVGQTGLREKDLNLLVAELAAEQLRQAGATVVLTRTGDYTMTAASRGQLAAALKPGLLVSIHHNGGGQIGGERPGTIVFTKTASEESDRFGGLFYQRLTPMLTEAAAPRIAQYNQYAQALAAHEAAVAAYTESLTAPQPNPDSRAEPGWEPEPRLDPEVIAEPAPQRLPEPAPFTAEPVMEFSWAGSANAGVRAWTRHDGQDYLAVLRNSGSVPAALVEFVYLSNPAEEALLADPAFIEAQARVLAESVIDYFANPDATGTGHVRDQFDDQPIGGSGGVKSCVEPVLQVRQKTEPLKQPKRFTLR